MRRAKNRSVALGSARSSATCACRGDRPGSRAVSWDVRTRTKRASVVACLALAASACSGNPKPSTHTPSPHADAGTPRHHAPSDAPEQGSPTPPERDQPERDADVAPPPDPPPRDPLPDDPPLRPIVDPRRACAAAGGHWRQVRNTCVDSCRAAQAGVPIACGMALTMGCDCGPAACWSGADCVPNPPPSGPLPPPSLPPPGGHPPLPPPDAPPMPPGVLPQLPPGHGPQPGSPVPRQ